MTKDLKTVALVALGVGLAGFVMSKFSDIGFINDLRRGFDA